MTQIVPLNKETHRALRVDGRASAAYGDNRRFEQVIVKEFAQLVVHYPILFSKDPQTGQFYCGVMLGIDEGENLFLDEWEVREFYRPLRRDLPRCFDRPPQLPGPRGYGSCEIHLV